MLRSDYETEVVRLARTGRPRLENPRSHGIFIRLTQEEDAQIKEYASKHNLTITQTLVEGFRALKAREDSGDE